MFLIVVLLNHEPMLFSLGILYLLTGPIVWQLERSRAKSAPPALDTESPSESTRDVL